MASQGQGQFGGSMQGIADQLLTLFGGGQTVTLRRYTETPDFASGSTTRVVAQEIEAKCVVDTFRQGEMEGIEFGDRKLIVSGADMAGVDITGSWTAQLFGGNEIPIQMPAMPISPDGTDVVWEILLRSGGSGG